MFFAAKMFFMSSNISNRLIQTIHKYKKYAEKGLVPNLYCSKNDGTHLPLVSRMDNQDHVYLYCLSCDWEKEVGWVTKDHLEKVMLVADSRLTT